MEGSLGQAEKQEQLCDWLGATECYENAVGMPTVTNPLEKIEIRERLSYAFFRAAMQAESSSEFRRRCAKAVECYEKARNSYKEFDSSSTTGRVLRCESMIVLLRYWLASKLSDRRALIELCWELTKKALEEFLKAGDDEEYARTYNLLSVSAGFTFAIQTDQEKREKTVREAIEFGERAITLLSKPVHSHELPMIYVRTSLFLGCLGQYFLNLDEREVCTKKSLRYWSRATKICEEAAFMGLLNSVPDAPPQFWGIGTKASLENLNKGLVYAKKTRDRFAIGCALDWLAFNLFWNATACENTAEISRLRSEAFNAAHDAKLQYRPILFTSTRGFSFPIEVADAICKCELGNGEVEVQKRRRLLEEAEEAARAGLARLEDAGYSFSILMARHELSKILVSLARIETEPASKKKILEEALNHRNLTVEGFKHLLPFHYFDQGFMIGFLVDTKCELAELTENEGAKRSILEEAVAEKEDSVKLAAKHILYYRKVGSTPLIVDFCRRQLEYANLLNRLYSLNKDSNCLKKEIKVLHEVAEAFAKLKLMGRVAECFWKIAQTHEVLGEESEAAVDFDFASDYYLKAAEKIPQLYDFYREKSSYMHAWSEIEKAKCSHRKQDYGHASMHFEKAANIHKSLEHRRYLAPNYFALARTDRAEELSKKERCVEAIHVFEQAAILFGASKKSIQKELTSSEDTEERRMAEDLLTAADLRRKYCMARITLENARILSKNGESYASAQKYGSAIDTFEMIANELGSEEDMREIRFITALSRAWQTMMLAEDKDMKKLYSESAQLFEKASEQSNGDAGRFLALGHSRFCKALEEATRFLDTQEMTTYSTAMQYLQSAKRYYKMAGLKNDVEHTKATELLMEAYAHINNAKREVDPEKKTRLYRMTEVILQASSERFAKIKQPEKKKQVLNLLKTVREEQELALSCAQVLRTPPLVSSAYFPAPTPTSERAIGLNGFEHAAIQAYLSASKEAEVGGELEIRLDLINVAKSFGLLVRIEKLIPSSLKVVDLDPDLSIEDGSLDLRGKRLEPLKIDSIKINVQPIEPGTISLNPKVVFVDDTGMFKICRPKPVHVMVKPRQTFAFNAKNADVAFSFLTSSFVEDYKNGIPLENSGWRSLVDLMKKGKVPRSSVYKAGGGQGAAIIELQKLGLVEGKTVSGERGRGGNILKLRICYDKEDVKRYFQERSFHIKGRSA